MFMCIGLGCTKRVSDGNDEAPTSLRIAYSAGAVHLAWDFTTTESYDGFNVHRSASNVLNFEQVNDDSFTDKEYTDTTISIGTTYYYKVSIVSDNVDIATSSIIGIIAAANS